MPVSSSTGEPLLLPSTTLGTCAASSVASAPASCSLAGSDKAAPMLSPRAAPRVCGSRKTVGVTTEIVPTKSSILDWYKSAATTHLSATTPL